MNRALLWLQLALLLVAAFVLFRLAAAYWHLGIWQDLFSFGK